MAKIVHHLGRPCGDEEGKVSMSSPFDDFKFKVGDVVRHRSWSHDPSQVKSISVAGVITRRSLNEGENGQVFKTYKFSSIVGTDDVLEVEIELANGDTDA